jgi:hemerythrin
MSESFRAALDEGQGRRLYGLFLDNLAAYCRAHFGFEECCMEEHCCPVALQNKQAHNAFTMLLVDFQQRYTARHFHSADARELVETLDQ